MRTRTLVLTALFTALTALGAFIRIPMFPAPITMQLLFCIMAGLFLKPAPAALSQVLYVALGLAGLPVFAGGGGLGYVVKPSFGYLPGFIAGAAVCGVLVKHCGKLTFLKAWLAGMSCVLTVYLIGAPYMYFMININTPGAMSAGTAAVSGFLVFLPGDIAKAVLAALAAVKLRPLVYRASI